MSSYEIKFTRAVNTKTFVFSGKCLYQRLLLYCDRAKFDCMRKEVLVFFCSQREWNLFIVITAALVSHSSDFFLMKP